METVNTSPTLSVVVPVYGSASILSALAARITAVLESMAVRFEVILVNDCSPDDSWDRIVALAAEDSRVRGIDLTRNYGQHAATLAGIRAARGAIIVTIDDDLQNPPEEIPKLLAKLDEGYDVVYGLAVTGDRGVLRDILTRLTKLGLRLAIGRDLPTNVSGFRAFNSRLKDAFGHFQSAYVSVDVLLSWGTSRFVTVPVRHEPRREGRSGYTYRALATHALNVLTGFTARPLHAVSLIGFATMLFGVGVLVYVLVYFFAHHGDVPGFPFLASIVAIFSGAQLLALGTIAEYIARMHTRLLGRPPFTVRHEVEGPSAPPRRMPTHPPDDDTNS